MQLITPRLILREYVAADEARFLAYQTDPRAREFYPPAPEEHAPGQALVSLFIQWAAEVPRRNWQLAIAERAQPEALIGSVGLRCAGLAPTAAEFGLELAPEYWGRRYGSEAAQALLTWGFTSLSLTVVHGTAISANARVAQLVHSLGFRAVAAPGTRERPAWLATRGWHEVRWEARREDWSHR